MVMTALRMRFRPHSSTPAADAFCSTSLEAFLLILALESESIHCCIRQQEACP